MTSRLAVVRGWPLAAASPSSRSSNLVANGIAVVHDLVLLFDRAVAEHAEVSAI